MRITDFRFRRVHGEYAYDGELWEERLVRPIDTYPEHREEPADIGRLKRGTSGAYDVSAIFLYVDSDDGPTGMFGPISSLDAYFIHAQIAPFITGEDPAATERVWDKMYKFLIHGRKGDPMLAISAVDIALWDLKGKWLGKPVFRLLGGPVRDSIPAYASALGHSLELELVAGRVKSFVRQGYAATKWFFRHAPVDGPTGVRKNMELVRTVREAAGEDMEIMFDAWNSWNVRYALEMANRMAEYRPRWLEEPVKPDAIDEYARIRAASPIPISGGEHEYTRWGARAYFDAGAVDVYQADTYWAGGISEFMKICALASAFDVQVIPHVRSVPVNAQVSMAQSPTVTPYVEYLVRSNETNQHFFTKPVRPVDGQVSLTEAPGIGLEIDEDKVLRDEWIAWG